MHMERRIIIHLESDKWRPRKMYVHVILTNVFTVKSHTRKCKEETNVRLCAPLCLHSVYRTLCNYNFQPPERMNLNKNMWRPPDSLLLFELVRCPILAPTSLARTVSTVLGRFTTGFGEFSVLLTKRAFARSSANVGEPGTQVIFKFTQICFSTPNQIMSIRT